MKQDSYYRWIGRYDPMPEDCTIWIENSSGYRYPVRSYEWGKRLVDSWNREVVSERDRYELRYV